MTNEQYFNELKACLRRLSEEEINDAVRFYTEYADDLGLSSYEEIAEHFGSPRELSSKIYAESAERNINEGNNKKSNNIWKGFAIALAGLFALPFSFPVIVICLSVGFALLVAAVSIFFAIIGTLFTLGSTGIFLFIKSFSFLYPLRPVIWAKAFAGGLGLIIVTALIVTALFFLFKFITKLLTLAISKLLILKNSKKSSSNN